MIFVLILLMAAADLSSVRAEPDPEKRSEAALTQADADVSAARDAYTAGDVKKMEQVLEDFRQSVALSVESLEQSHKRARNSRFYKRAELRTRALVRRLTTLANEVGIDDRKPVEEARQRVQDVHDQLLSDIMSKKK